MGTHPIFESDFDCLTDFRERWPFLVVFSISPLVDKQLDALSWNFDLMLFQRQLKTSELFVLEKKVLDTRDHHSIESSHNSCVRVVISQTTMVLVVNPFMVTSLKMKTFN